MFYLISMYLFFMNLMTWMMSMNFLILKINKMFYWNMLIMNSMKIEYIIYIDWMSLIFMNTVMLISSMVILYSMNYMHNDIYMKRFMMIVLIFVLSMILMILSMNMFSILLGWDGLGLSSYCLVAYYQNKKSFNSSMITIMMNRVGDIMILMTISMLMFMGSLNFLMFNKMNMFILILIMIAAMTKSAQIPFSSWLPMAMAAPTPVSSLVHSSTLVTAGVYLLIRFSHLMNYNLMFFLMMLSCLTMFMAGFSAMFEFDLKKIIALSTLSQLGLMILTITLNLPKMAFFHLITHAMFKSLLFLCAGIIIHNYLNTQDIRMITFLNFKFPFINTTFNIATMTLCGMPFLTGFYSKDLIIEMFNMHINNLIMFIMMYMSMMFTVMYSFRLMYYTTMKENKMPSTNFYFSKNLMNYSILILLLMSIFYGSILNWILFSSLTISFLNMYLKTLIFFTMMISMMLMLIMIKFNTKIYFMKKFKYIMKFMNSMWLLNFILKKNKMNILLINNKMNNLNDLGWLEYLSCKKTIFNIKYFSNFKKFNKMNFFTLIIMNSLILLYMIIL